MDDLEAAVIALKFELGGVQELHRREVELRSNLEKVRDGQLRVIIDLQKSLDQAEADLQVLGLKLLRLQDESPVFIGSK